MSDPNAPTEVFERALAGERRMLARAITLLEAGNPEISEAMRTRSPKRWNAPGAPHVVGLTGPPGSGKSTLTDRLVASIRGAGRTVAVVAVDPASPFTGGAILGDRVRLEAHCGDEGVYVRSLSSRGHLGGLSRATSQVVDLLDIVGFDVVLIETVGVGQSEIGVMEIADSVVVVLTPESGDQVQTMKAGLLEVADVFVVNKADRPGAERLAKDLALAVELDEASLWSAPVHTASALHSEGIGAVVESVRAHGEWLTEAGRDAWASRRASGRRRLCLDLISEWGREAASRLLDGDAAELRASLDAGSIDPFAAAQALAAKVNLD